MRLEVPFAFDLKATVLSHGWYQLAPFRYEPETGGLFYVFSGGGRRAPVSASVRESDGVLHLAVDGKQGVGPSRVAAEGFARILSIECDLSEFHANVGSDERLAWVARTNAGRLLRSATVFEDLVKTICTTNCSWGLTRSMVRNLVDSLGSEAEGGEKAFPLPEAMAQELFS
jgi:3-methyladenine DNA glycosylase/8-oxoguanine DNA glycosylase